MAVWQRFLGLDRWWRGAVMVVAAMIVTAVAVGCGGSDDGDDQAVGEPTQAATETTPVPTETRQAATQIPATATEGLAAFTAAECAYAEAMNTNLNQVGDASLELADLFTEAAGDPSRFFDDNWIISVAAGLVTLQLSNDEVQALTAPDSMADIHRRMSSAFQKAADATTPIADGIDNLDPDAINVGTGLFIEATADITTANELLETFIAGRRPGTC